MLPDNETRIKILDIAEELFSARGYSAVTLRDIASAAGMRHASLYYYVPGGKEQLFVEVMERNFQRHRTGMAQAIREAGSDLQSQVHSIAHWLTSQPPLDFVRMQKADMPAISDENARRLMELAYDALRLPIVSALEQARQAGQVNLVDLNLAAMALISLILSVHSIPGLSSNEARLKIGQDLADMLLNGWLKR
jgi:AcrR family transcriptional regulator